MTIFDILSGQLKMDTSQFKAGLDSAGNDFSNAMNRLGQLGRRGFLALSAAASAAAVGIFALVKRAADMGEEMQKVSTRVGVSVEALSGLKFAAELSESNLGELEIGLRMLAKSANEAATGSAAFADVFARLGVQFVDANFKVRSTEQLFLELADAIAKMPNATERTAIAMQLFGRSGTALLPLLTQGREGIEAMRQKAAELGLVMSTQAAAAADAFNDKLQVLQARISGAALRIGQEMMPVVEGLIDKLDEWLGQPENLKAFEDGLRNVLVILQTMTEVLAKVVQGWSEIVKWVKAYWEVVTGGGNPHMSLLDIATLPERAPGRGAVPQSKMGMGQPGAAASPPRGGDGASLMPSLKQVADDVDMVAKKFDDWFNRSHGHIKTLDSDVGLLTGGLVIGLVPALEAINKRLRDQADAWEQSLTRASAYADQVNNMISAAQDMLASGLGLQDMAIVFQGFRGGAEAIATLRDQLIATTQTIEVLLQRGLAPDKIPAALRAMGINANVASAAMAQFQQRMQGVAQQAGLLPGIFQSVRNIVGGVFQSINQITGNFFQNFGVGIGGLLGTLQQASAEQRANLIMATLQSQIAALAFNIQQAQQLRLNPEQILEMQRRIAELEARLIDVSRGGSGLPRETAVELGGGVEPRGATVNVAVTGYGQQAARETVDEITRELYRRGIPITNRRGLRMQRNRR